MKINEHLLILIKYLTNHNDEYCVRVECFAAHVARIYVKEKTYLSNVNKKI